jgi:hypothetical protein
MTPAPNDAGDRRGGNVSADVIRREWWRRQPELRCAQSPERADVQLRRAQARRTQSGPHPKYAQRAKEAG